MGVRCRSLIRSFNDTGPSLMTVSSRCGCTRPLAAIAARSHCRSRARRRPGASLACGVLSSSRRWRASSEIRNSRGHWKRWPRISNTPAGTAPPAGGAAAHQERRPRPLVLSLADAMHRRRRRRSLIASCSLTHTVDRWCNTSPAVSPITNRAVLTHLYCLSLMQSIAGGAARRRGATRRQRPAACRRVAR